MKKFSSVFPNYLLRFAIVVLFVSGALLALSTVFISGPALLGPGLLLMPPLALSILFIIGYTLYIALRGVLSRKPARKSAKSSQTQKGQSLRPLLMLLLVVTIVTGGLPLYIVGFLGLSGGTIALSMIDNPVFMGDIWVSEDREFDFHPDTLPQPGVSEEQVYAQYGKSPSRRLSYRSPQYLHVPPNGYEFDRILFYEKTISSRDEIISSRVSPLANSPYELIELIFFMYNGTLQHTEVYHRVNVSESRGMEWETGEFDTNSDFRYTFPEAPKYIDAYKQQRNVFWQTIHP